MFLRFARYVPANGIVFAVLVVIATLLVDRPGTGASNADVVAYYADSGNRTKELVSLLLIGLAVLSFVSFLGSLRGLFARGEGEPARLTTVVVAGGAVFVALAVAAHAVGAAMAQAEESFDHFAADPNTAWVLWSLNYWLFVSSLFAAAAMTMAATVLGFQTGAIPRWLAALSAVATVGGILGFLAWPSLLVLAWIAVISGWMLLPARGATSAA